MHARSHWQSFLTLLIICSGLTITVLSISEAQTLQGTAPTLNITTAVPGSEPTSVTVASSQIVYNGLNGKVGRITVMTQCPGQKFNLSVVAGTIANGGGTAAPAVTLLNGMLATDFITNIKKNSGPFTVTLNYTSAPHFSDGTGSDSHNVTYTLTQ
jgi:hypothetical protein